jgi:hypothetical protein
MDKDPNPVAQEQLLLRPEAAKYLISRWRIPCSVSTLAKLAVIGDGPEFRKSGRTPLYPQDALDAYAQAKLTRRVRSTSELSTKAAVLQETAA